MISFKDVWVLYQREMRAALRERTIVINSILIPLFLYPFFLWAAFTGILFVQGQTEGFVSRVLVKDWPSTHSELRHNLDKIDKVMLQNEDLDTVKAAERIKAGELEAMVEFLPAEGESAKLAGNFAVRVTYNQSKERSAAAKERIDEWLNDYRDSWLKREVLARGAATGDWQVFSLKLKDLASSKQIGTFILGLMAPLFFAIMVAVGCFYPAVDATAGERERNTWETTMSLAASRGSVVAAKYLVVASFGFFAGTLNLTAMTLSLGPIMAPLTRATGESLEFSVPLSALPIMALAAVLLSAFVAGGMLVFAVFAKTFKEGQSMITPFYMLVIMPVMIMQVPGIEFSLPLALLPVANVAFMVRDSISGIFHWPLIAVTILSSGGYVALCVWLATTILKFEDVVMGSYKGTLFSLLKQRLGKRTNQTKQVAR